MPKISIYPMPLVSAKVTADLVQSFLKDANWLLEGKIDTDNIAEDGTNIAAISSGVVVDLPSDTNYIRAPKLCIDCDSPARNFKEDIFDVLTGKIKNHKMIVIAEASAEVVAKPENTESGRDDLRLTRSKLRIPKPRNYQLIYVNIPDKFNISSANNKIVYLSDSIKVKSMTPCVMLNCRMYKKQDDENIYINHKVSIVCNDYDDETVFDIMLFYRDIDETVNGEFIYLSVSATAYYEVIL